MAAQGKKPKPFLESGHKKDGGKAGIPEEQRSFPFRSLLQTQNTWSRGMDHGGTPLSPIPRGTPDLVWVLITLGNESSSILLRLDPVEPLPRGDTNRAVLLSLPR